MEWYILILAGICGGVIGGMGMGGGTLLIPILTIFLGIAQHTAQGINLLVFIPTSIVALIIHAKNKLLDYKTFLFIIIPAICASVGLAFVANKLQNSTLRMIFGIFLIVIGIVMLTIAIIKCCKKKFTEKLGI